jgi:hypothetical protein
MAITALEYLVLTDLRERDAIPPKPNLLEFGSQNWYGDVSFKAVKVLAGKLLSNDPERYESFKDRYDHIVGQVEKGNIVEGLRQFCYLFYRLVFDFASYSAIDLIDGPGITQHDLNLPIQLDRQFDIVTNIGTAEHVFDISQVFSTAHELTAANGLMIHTAPFTGWWNHGFFAVQPNLYFDLAEANGYELVALTYGALTPFEAVRIDNREDIRDFADAGRIDKHAVFNCVLKKGPENKPFKKPTQRLYSGKSSDQEIADWRKHR